MSTLVDERVVTMRFDNRDFEKNTRQSMSTIQKLKASLNFSGVANSVNQSVNSIDMNPLIAGLEKTEKAFSTWEVAAITAISNITNRIVDLGINLAKSLSVDQIMSGWERFSEITRNTGTLINQLTNEGYSDAAAMSAVVESLDKLMWYSDATSFKIEQLTNAVSQFKNKGKSLDDSLDILAGLGNLGASVGKSADDVTELFGIITKLKDTVMTMQFDQLDMRGLMSTEFKNMLLDLSTDGKDLIKTIDTFTDEVIYRYKGSVIDVDNLRESISLGWLKADVVYDALKKYGFAVSEIYDLNQKLQAQEDKLGTGKEISAYDAIEKYNKAVDDEVKAAKALVAEMEALNDVTGLANAKLQLSQALAKQFSGKWTDAATEARTFSEAVEAVKDAVRTEWSRIFTLVIGDYYKAVDVWSHFSDKLYDFFASPIKNIRRIIQNDNFTAIQESLFGNTKEKAGAGEIGAIWNLMNAIQKLSDTVKQAFKEVFKTDKKLSDIAEDFRRFTEKLIMTDETAVDVKNIFKGIFSIFKIGIKILQGVKIALDPIFKAIIGDSGNFVKFLGELGNKIYDFANNTTIFTHIGQKFADVFTAIINAFKEVKIIENVTKRFKEFFSQIKVNEEFRKGLTKLASTANAVFDLFLTGLSKIIHFFGDYVIPAVLDAIPYLLGFIGLVGKALGTAIKWLIDSVRKLAEFIKGNESIQNGWKNFIEFMRSIPDRLKKLQPFFIKLGISIRDFFVAIWSGIKKIGTGIANLFKLNTIGELFAMIGDKIAYGFRKIIDGINSLSSSDTGEAVSSIKEKLAPLEPLFKGLIDLFKGLWSVFKAIIPVIGAILSAVGNLLTQISNSITKTFNQKMPGDGGFNLWYLINGGIGLLIAKGLYDFVYLFNGITSAIANTIDALGSVMRAKAVMSWALAIKTVASAILMLVGAILIITLIDPEKLKTAVNTLGQIMAMLTAVILIMSKFLKTSYTSDIASSFGINKGKGLFFDRQGTTSGQGFAGVAGMILAFGLSVLALVAALKIIDGISTDKLAQDLGVLALLMGMLALAIGMMNAIANLGSQSKTGIKGIKGILSFALAILIMTIPLQKIGDMDTDKLAQALLAVGAILLAYAFAVRIANGLKAKAMTKMAVAAAGLVAMVGPIQMLASMDLASLAKGVGAVSVLMFMFGAMAAMSSDFKMGNAIGIIAVMFGFAKIIEFVVKLMTNKDMQISDEAIRNYSIIIGSIIVFVGVLIFGLKTIKKKTSEVKKTDGTELLKKLGIIAGILLAVAGAAVLMMYAGKLITSVNWASFAVGLSMFVVVVAAAFGIMEYAKRTYIDTTAMKNLAYFSVVLLTLSTVMLSIGKLAKDLSGLDDKAPQTIGLVLGSLVLVLVSVFALASIAKGISGDIMRTIVGMSAIFLALSVLMISIATAVKVMGSANAGTLQSTILIIAASVLSAFALFAVAALFKDKIMDCAKSMIILAGAFAIFAVGALAFAEAAALMKGNVLGIVLIAGAMIALAVAAKILGSAQPTLLTIAVAFAAMGIAVLAVGASIYLIILALEKMLPMLDELAAKGEQLKTVISSSIQGIVEGIANALPVLTTQIMTSLDILLSWVWQKLGEFVQKFLDLDVKKFKAVIDKLVELLFVVVMSILEGLEKNIGKIVDKLVSIILNAVYALIARLPEIAQALFDLVIGLIDAFGEALANNAERLRESIVNFAKNMWQAFLNFFGIHSPSKESESAAGNIVAGLIQGLAKGIGKVVNELIKMGSKMLREVLKLPKKFIKAGFDILKAFLDGLKSIWNTVWNWLCSIWEKIKSIFTGGNQKQEFKDAGKEAMTSYKDGMETVTDDANATAKDVIQEVAKELSKTEYFQEIGKQIVRSIAVGIEGMSGEISSALSDMLYDAVDELEDNVDELQDAMGSSGLDKFINSFENVVYGGLSTAFDALNDTIFTPLNDSIRGSIDIFKAATPDIGNECKKVAAVVKSFGNIGNATENALVMHINDLSNLAVTDINGMSSAVSTCMDSMTQVIELKWRALNKALNEGHDWLADTIAQLKDLIDSELDFSDEELTIRPVMDISDIEEKTGQIAGMLYSVGNISVASASVNAEKASSEIAATKQMQEATTSTTTQVSASDEQGGTYNLTFNITGNDPKAIADEVSKRFQQYTSRRNTAYGRGNI